MTFDQLIDSYRIVPRVMMVTLYIVWIISAMSFLNWFTAHDWNQYESAANAAAVMAYPSAHMGIISALINSLQKNYTAHNKAGSE